MFEARSFANLQEIAALSALLTLVQSTANGCSEAYLPNKFGMVNAGFFWSDIPSVLAETF